MGKVYTIVKKVKFPRRNTSEKLQRRFHHSDNTRLDVGYVVRVFDPGVAYPTLHFIQVRFPKQLSLIHFVLQVLLLLSTILLLYNKIYSVKKPFKRR